MRRMIVAIALAATLAGPATARAQDAAAEVGWAALAAFANLGYVPGKIGVAVCGLAVGAVASVLTGGNQRAAYAFWVPTASGDYFVRPDHLAGERPLDFIGRDYADTPSARGRMADATPVYDAMYDTK